MKTTNEIAQAAVNEMDKGMICNSLHEWNDHCVNIITKAIEAAMAQGEPVAYLYCNQNGEVDYDTDPVVSNTPGDTWGRGDYWMPVFKASPPKRQPLTIEAIWEVVCATAKDGEVDAPSFEEFMSEPDVENVIAFFRRIEAAINGGGA